MSSADILSEALKVFQDSQDIASTDPFLEALKHFLRTGRLAEQCQQNLNQAVIDFNLISGQVWQYREKSLALQGVCGDRNKVTHQHVYSVEEFCETTLQSCSKTGKSAIGAAKSFADGIFDSSVAVSRVEVELFSYLRELKSGGLDDYSSRRVFQIIGVLFKLLRTCAPDDHFAEHIIRWIYIYCLNSVLLPNESEGFYRGRLLLLLHVLRVHNVFLPKLIPLIQPPVLQPSTSGEFEKFKTLYFAMLQTLLVKSEDRSLFVNPSISGTLMSSPSQATESDKFIFVDEFNGGTAVSLQPADVEEPSLIQLLAQFEISRVLAIIFPESHSSPVASPLYIDFAQRLVDILFCGMNSYNAPPFRAFLKTMMFHVCEVLQLSKQHFEGPEYEQLLLATFRRFSSDMKFAFSSLWVKIPYERLSPDSRCKIACEICDIQALPEGDILAAAKAISVVLFRLPLHDSAYLLNVLLAIASAAYDANDQNKDRVTDISVATSLLMSHFVPNASDVLWKVNRNELLRFISQRAVVINRVIEIISLHLSSQKPGSTSNAVRSWIELSDFIKLVDYSKFQPDESTWNILQMWLINAEITSGEYMLAKDVLSNLSWAPRAAGLPSFLDQSHHNRCAIILLRWVARSNLPNNDRKIAWSIMLRLHLINRNPPQSQFSVAETAPFVKAGEPLASYAALLMSPTINSSVEAFVSQGLPLVKNMLDKRYFNEAINALLLVLADHYTRHAFEYLMASKDFCELIDRLLTCSMIDMVKGWAFESTLPKDVLVFGIVGHMRSMNAYMVLEFWLCILGRCSEGFQKASVMDALELLLSLTPALPDGLATLNSVLSKHYVDFVESARKHVSPVRAFVSWIVGLPFSLVQLSSQSNHWPWFCLTSLSHDLQTEFETSFALRFHEQMLASPNTSLEKVYKQTMAALEQDSAKSPSSKQLRSFLPTSADNIAVLRLAHYASQQAAPNHPATPLAWLLFFRAFLRRPTWSAKGCGYVLLQQHQASNKKQIVPALIAALKTASEAMAATAAASHTAKECYQLYQAMILWLDEPRLHVENFDAKQLPAAFMPDLVNALIDPSSDPWPSETLQMWLLRYVDLQDVASQVNLYANKFRAIIEVSNVNSSIQQATLDDTSNIADSKPPIASYLQLPDSANFGLRMQFPDITDATCRDLSSALQILMASLDAFRLYSTWIGEQESIMAVAYEKIVETLPLLCSYENVEERITKPCSTFTSYLRPCSSPAVLIAKYRKAKRIASQDSILNQSAAQIQSAIFALTSLVSPSSSQAPVQISVAAIRLEALISRIVETEGAEDTGRSLYYTIATFIDNNPSMWQTGWDRFLSQCMEMLGQAFVRTCEIQQKPGRGGLLETILNSVKSDYVRRLMSSDFVPYPPESSGLLETIASAIAARKISPDFTFSLLSRFDAKAWGDLTLQQRAALLGSSLRCIVCSMAHADFASHMLLDLLINTAAGCMSHTFPENLHATLENFVFFTETYPSCVLPSPLWKLLLSTVLGSSDANAPMISVDGPLSLQIIDHELRYLAEAFNKARTRIETSPAWKSAVAPLSLIASRFFCLAVDRAVLVARVTSAEASSFDMYGMMMTIFGPLVSAPTSNTAAHMADLKPSFAAYGDCLLHLQQASNVVRFVNTNNLFSRLLSNYVEEMMEAAIANQNYAKELHLCIGRLPWFQFTPSGPGEVEVLEMLCSRDEISAFWTGTASSIDWKAVAQSSSNFTSTDARAMLVSSLVRMGYNATLRHPRNTPIGDLVAGCLVESIKQMDLELLPSTVYSQLCNDARGANNRPLPPQVIIAWASKQDDGSLRSLCDCLIFLENVAGGFSGEKVNITESVLARSCNFIRLIGMLLFDWLNSDVLSPKQSSQQQQQTAQAINHVISAMLIRCEMLLNSANSSAAIDFVASRVCAAGLQPLNQSVAFGTRLVPAYINYFNSPSSVKTFSVYWLSTACRMVTAAPVAVSIAEALLRVYRQFSPSFTWETAQTLTTFTLCQASTRSSAPLAPSAPGSSVTLSSNQSVNILGMSSPPLRENASENVTPLDELILLANVAVSSDSFLVIQALARRAIAYAFSQPNNFEQKKATIFTLTDVLLRTSESPKATDETRLLGLWSLWFNNLIEVESFLSREGVNCGAGYNSLALDLAFVARLSNVVTTLMRLGEMRSSRGILGAIGLGSKSVLQPWFHLFARGAACLLVRQYPDCISRSNSSSASSNSINHRQLLESLSALRNDREYTHLAGLINAIAAINQDISLPFATAIERFVGEFRAYNG